MAPNTLAFELLGAPLLDDDGYDETFLLNTQPYKQNLLRDVATEDKQFAVRRAWKTKLKAFLPEDPSTDCTAMRDTHSADNITPDSAIDDGSILDALSTIRILHKDCENNEWLSKYQGELHTLPMDLIERVANAAPKQFGARVADFNENLFYDMQTQHGLSQLGIRNDPRLADTLGTQEFLGSFLTTESTTPQPAHVDYTWEVLEEQGSHLMIGFFPLTQEGMFLQVWPRNDDISAAPQVQGELIHVPFGNLLLLPASTIHGGGFRTTPSKHLQPYGNLRFHLYVARTSSQDQDAGSGSQGLPEHQTNKYTEPFDKRRELCERYIDAPCMHTLQEFLFV